MPVSMRKHTGTHTCDVWSKGTGDGGLEETLANKTIKPPQAEPLAALAKQSDNPANQSPSPRPPLQQPTLSRMHPSKPIAGSGADWRGSGRDEVSQIENLRLREQGKKPEPKHAPQKNTPKNTRQTCDDNPMEPNEAVQTHREDAAK